MNKIIVKSLIAAIFISLLSVFASSTETYSQQKDKPSLTQPNDKHPKYRKHKKRKHHRKHWKRCHRRHRR